MTCTSTSVLAFILSVTIVPVPCGAAGSATETGPQDDRWVPYRSEPFGFELRYPAGWELIIARAAPDSQAAWEAHVLEGEQVHKATFRETLPGMWQGEFQVCVWSLADTVSFEDWLAAHEPTDVTGGSLVQDVSDAMLAGCTAKRLSIFGFDHEEIEVLCSRGGRLYELSFAGANPNDEDVLEHRQIYAAMVESFHFLE